MPFPAGSKIVPSVEIVEDGFLHIGNRIAESGPTRIRAPPHFARIWRHVI